MQKIRWMGYFLAAAVAVALLTAAVWRPAPPKKFAGLEGSQVPDVIQGLHGKDLPVDDATRQALASADIVSRRFIDSSGVPIDVTIIGGTDRTALHDPRSCLVGAGDHIEDDHIESLSGFAQPVPIRSCHALAPNASETDTTSQSSPGWDMLYLYVSNGHIIASASQIRMKLLESALLEQNDTPTYFVRVETLLPPPADGRAAQVQEHAKLAAFAGDLWEHFSPVLYQGGRA